MGTTPSPNNARLLFRGATRACPVCGQRRLTRKIVNLVEECPQCRFRFERKPGHFVGAVGMNTIFTFGLILFSILGGVAVLWPDVTVKPLLIVPITVALLVPALVHPSAKTLWVGIDLMMNPVEPGEADGVTTQSKTN